MDPVPSGGRVFFDYGICYGVEIILWPHNNFKRWSTMLADAVMSIRRSNEAAMHRRYAQLARRHPIELLDSWVREVETLIEDNCPSVPEPLIAEIAGFLERLDMRFDTRLYHRLRGNSGRQTRRVLDVLFEAEENLLVRLAATAWPGGRIKRQRFAATGAEYC